MKRLKLFLLCLVFPALAFAHGGEDHRHDEAPASGPAAGAQSRFETATETFEIVGRLQDGELSLLIDRFETNEPVLNGNVEVELNGQKAIARFHADHGDYAIDDPAFVKALASPGKHALTFTVAAGNDMDLLEATMEVAADAQAGAVHAAPGISLTAAAIAGIILTIVLAAMAIALARREPSTGNRP